MPNSDNASFAAAGAAADGTPNVKFGGKLTVAVVLRRDEAKKFGTAEDPLPVTLASSCSAAGCLGAEASTEGPGLGGMRAICGTASITGVSGAGAETDRESAAMVTGTACWEPSLKPFGRRFGAAFSASLSFAASPDGAAPKKLGVGVAVVDLVSENGSAAIGGSLAFVESC